MPEFDIDEYIRKRRQKENLFGTVKDSRTGYHVSFPLVDSEKKTDTISFEIKTKEKPIEPTQPIEKQKPTVTIGYDKESYQNLNICFWKINLAYGMDWNIPWDLKKWADGKIELKDNAKVWLTKSNEDEMPPELYLIIGGKGHDNRCTWCKSFWTAFKNNSEDRSFEIDKSKSCIFDV